jgi:hypothetical protein
MIDIATKLVALQLPRKGLQSSATSHLFALGDLCDEHSELKLVSLGALGTAIGNFSAVRVPATATFRSAAANT